MIVINNPPSKPSIPPKPEPNRGHNINSSFPMNRSGMNLHSHMAVPNQPQGQPDLPEARAEGHGLFFHGNGETSKRDIDRLFEKSLPFHQAVKYHYNRYKLEKSDLDALHKDFSTRYGKRVDRKEYVKEINRIITQEKQQDTRDPEGWKKVLKLREEERLLKEVGGLKGLIGKHKRIIPKYNWSKKMTGDKS